MVILRTIENLRERPKDERRAVALGVALAVVAILFVGWAIFFVRKVQSGADLQQVNQAYTQAVEKAKDSFNQSGQTDKGAQTYTPPSADSSVLQLIQETVGTSSAQ